MTRGFARSPGKTSIKNRTLTTNVLSTFDEELLYK